jgi:beta-barrel assembly-enhancing protease
MIRQCRTSWYLIVLVGLLAFSSGCAISEKDEISMGKEAAPQFEKKFGGLYPDSEVQRYVHDVGMRMVPFTGRTNLPWDFRVVNSKQINAFALPGGHVFVTQGLLFNLQNEAQIAAILGHEETHIAHRHTVKQLERQQAISGGLTLAGIFAGSTVANVGQLVTALASLQYSRDQEKEADLTGLSYMAKAGYDPHAMVQTMQILQKVGGGGGPQFLSDHPNPPNRIEYLNKQIEHDYGNVISTGRTGEAEFRNSVLAHRR